jgi:hypothetical protein
MRGVNPVPGELRRQAVLRHRGHPRASHGPVVSPQATDVAGLRGPLVDEELRRRAARRGRTSFIDVDDPPATFTRW